MYISVTFTSFMTFTGLGPLPWMGTTCGAGTANPPRAPEITVANL